MTNENPPGTSGDEQPDDVPEAADVFMQFEGISGDTTKRTNATGGGSDPDPGGNSGTAAASIHHTRGICEWEPLTCLVVEDDDSVRELCEQTLTDAGHDVLSAASAQEALDLVASTGNGGGRVDLVITDVVMPGMNGDELAAELTRQFPQTRTLYVSGHDPAELGIDPGRGRGQEDPENWWRQARPDQTVEAQFLAKPFTPEQLTVAAALASTSPDWPASDWDLNDLVAVTDRKSGSVIYVDTDPVENQRTHSASESGQNLFAFMRRTPDPTGGGSGGGDPLEADATQRIDVNNHRPGWYVEDGTVVGADASDPAASSGHRDTFGTGWSFPPEHVRRALRRFTPPGFGTFTVRKRVAAIGVAAGIAVLATAALVLAGSGGEVELAADEAGDVEIEEAAVSDDERDAGEGDDPEGQTQTGDGSQQSGSVSGGPNQQTQGQSGSDSSQTATVEGDGNQQTQDRPGDAGTQSGDAVEAEPTVAYEAPTVGDPVLASCTASRTDGGSTEYAVAYTVATTGGTYDVLPDEPFIGNDQRLEVRGGDLTWTVEMIHVREAGDEADPFYVAAPDVLGWAEPGGDVRQHAHQPPPLEVHRDECRG